MRRNVKMRCKAHCSTQCHDYYTLSYPKKGRKWITEDSVGDHFEKGKEPDNNGGKRDAANRFNAEKTRYSSIYTV